MIDSATISITRAAWENTESFGQCPFLIYVFLPLFSAKTASGMMSTGGGQYYAYYDGIDDCVNT